MLTRVILSILAFYFLMSGYFFYTQNQQIYNTSGSFHMDRVSGENIENIALKVADNVLLDGALHKANVPDAPLIIYYGTNGDDATRFLSHVPNLKGYDIVTFNYQGYGFSQGVPSQKIIFEDALAIYDTYAKDRKVIIVGRSLGTSVATYVASRRQAEGLVLITPFDSLASLIKSSYFYLPIDLLLRDKYETVNFMPLVKSKIGVIEVEHDTAVDIVHLKLLIEKMPHFPLHIKLKDTSHESVLRHPEFESGLKEMIETMLDKPKS